ncbi:hypothetical protein COU00_00055 [Candidatus Falkowbacteria bacterium CG10_big_fil_rev_8_21_14_0_10_43_11]|uniref:Uncharacterized protein n=1 Tax=Candidatus Falkowbacteria bacterium CG10_big_fil_rev_8_21_14_0_10_43_11 TaxID=1974568 RepID=A0A2M6WN81_9BACT|nr:MAG: hypothetical protein COU00_00055 [Candidatus Falkowbacteria bacterium CG10_big_fil_rev_8_21_14_0_10_43_11]
MIENIRYIRQELKIYTHQQKNDILIEIMEEGKYGAEILTDHKINDAVVEDEAIWVGVNRDEIKEAVRKKLDMILGEKEKKIQGFHEKMNKRREEHFKDNQTA